MAAGKVNTVATAGNQRTFSVHLLAADGDRTIGLTCLAEGDPSIVALVAVHEHQIAGDEQTLDLLNGPVRPRGANAVNAGGRFSAGDRRHERQRQSEKQPECGSFFSMAFAISAGLHFHGTIRAVFTKERRASAFPNFFGKQADDRHLKVSRDWTCDARNTSGQNADLSGKSGGLFLARAGRVLPAGAGIRPGRRFPFVGRVHFRNGFGQTPRRHTDPESR